MGRCEHCEEAHEESVLFCPQNGSLITAHLLAPDTLLENKYRVGRAIGVGGMGAVYAARHEILGQDVAIKVLLPALSANQEMSARLVREGRAASATRHRNIAMVTDMGWTETRALFVVMEFLRGKTIEQLCAAGPMDIVRSAKLLSQVLEGLEAVHRGCIIHRDLKPENVMVVQDGDEEVAKILDFGISKMNDDENKLGLTSTGLVMGTPQFMSPEQSRGAADVDHRADLYSAGGIFYKMLTGRPPVTANTLADMIYKLNRGDIDPPSKHRAEVPAALDRVVMRALAVKPDARYSDARVFRRALVPFCEESSLAEQAASSATIATSPDAAGIDFSSLVSLDEVGTSATPTAVSAPAPAPAPVPTTPAAQAVAPSAPRHDDSAFAPPVQASAFSAPGGGGGLELDLERTAAVDLKAERAASTITQAPIVSVHSVHYGGGARRGGGGASRLGLLALLAVGAAGGYYYYSKHIRSSGLPTGPRREGTTIDVQTVPVDAKILVDGVLQVSRPLHLPHSLQPFVMRVEAAGYKTEILNVVPDRDQQLVVSLRPRSSAGAVKRSRRPRTAERRRRRRRSKSRGD